MSDLTPTSLAGLLSISVPYASQVLSGARELPRELAVRIYRETGQKLGPLANATEDEIDALERVPLRERLSRPVKAEPPSPRKAA